jgi:hypothetical protein
MDDKQLNQAVKEGWITKNQREKITSRGYLSYLARTNKEKGHKPKPSLKPKEWEKEQAKRALKKSSKPIAKKNLKRNNKRK